MQLGSNYYTNFSRQGSTRMQSVLQCFTHCSSKYVGISFGGCHVFAGTPKWVPHLKKEKKYQV